MRGKPKKADLSVATVHGVDCVSGLPIVAAARGFRGPAQFDSQARILETKPTKAVPQS
jgi:hypothetical protein